MTLLDLLQHHLSRHAHVHLNHRKARVWNAAGQAPRNISDLGPEVWVGNHSSLPHVQGLRVLGVPIGHPAYIQTQLQQISAQHSEFLEKIPALEDVQASWLLPLFCACPRANYLLRNLPPPTTATFASDHDVAVASTLTELLQTSSLPAAALARVHLLFLQGGLGLTCATCLAHAAYWASWADALPTL